MNVDSAQVLKMPSPILSPKKIEMLTVIRNRKTELLNEIKSLEDEINDISAQIENMDILEENKTSSQTKKLAIGKKKFNMDSNKGIIYMIENEILKPGAEDIAYFLYHGEGLNKTAIGEYLGENNVFNIEVLNYFVKLHEFTNMILVQALRQFLWSFRLPGEAQKIDRLMECFAKHYCDCNPGVFHHTDTCYILSFSIIMLNTSLHNPSVKEKPSLQRFIEMNKGIDAGENLPDDLLSSLYNSIKKEPFKIPEDDGNDLMHTFFNPVKEGWLWKQGGRYKTWKRRWFVLADACLYYFQFTTDKEPRGIIPLQNLKIRPIPSTFNPVTHTTYPAKTGSSKDNFNNLSTMVHSSKSNHVSNNTTGNFNNIGAGNYANVFEILPMIDNEIIKACKKSDNEGGKVVEGKHCVYRMSASSPVEAQAWVTALNSQTKYYLNHRHNSTYNCTSTSLSSMTSDSSLSRSYGENKANGDRSTGGKANNVHLYRELLSLRRQYNGK
ncbi:unnamed protein product [Gordionus sp. m RMFG-2023]|uniref:cytohesin-1-like n=1 Tax=Gordionus sp. m RMFG-2023 TaxID=3053472 RepID=UPI0030DF0A3B